MPISKARTIDAHRGGEGGEGGIKVYPPSKFYAKLVNKNAIKHQKGVPKNFHNPYIPSLPKFGKNLLDPPPRISNRVHLWQELSKKIFVSFDCPQRCTTRLEPSMPEL